MTSKMYRSVLRIPEAVEFDFDQFLFYGTEYRVESRQDASENPASEQRVKRLLSQPALTKALQHNAAN
jgi:hypothetical protein